MCGHPLAARAIGAHDGGNPFTYCWACRVEKAIETVDNPSVLVDSEHVRAPDNRGASQTSTGGAIVDSTRPAAA